MTKTECTGFSHSGLIPSFEFGIWTCHRNCMHGLLSYFSNLPSILLLVFGFGFVVFWHELGHFIAAKWAGVKVEQFAVGFGTAMCSWRRGMGFTWGSSGKKLDAMSAAEQEKYGETEYRINWLPLGGYVYML